LLGFMETNASSNLLYVQEAITSMAESGALIVEDGVCVLTKGAMDVVNEIPVSIEAVISSRIARLTAPQQQLLCCAAVIGNDFTLDTLLQVHPAPDLLMSVNEDLKVLLHRNLVEGVGGMTRQRRGSCFNFEGYSEAMTDHGINSHQTFQFVHKFTQEIAYQRMLVSTRRQVHFALAQHIETLYANDIKSHYGILADHYYKAERLAEAKFYLVNAGDVSISCLAYLEAVKFFSKALEVLDQIKISPNNNDSNKSQQNGNVKMGYNGASGEQLQTLKGGVGVSNFAKPIQEEGHIHRQLAEARYALGGIRRSREHAIKALNCFGDRVDPGGSGSMNFISIRLSAWYILSRMKSMWEKKRYSELDEKPYLLAVEKSRAWYILCQLSYLQNDTYSNLSAFFKCI